MTGVYYNEFDDYPAQWLENLIAAGHLPAGDVDRRSITEVQPEDVQGYVQAHFFAGIGGWPLAFRLAGWPDTRPVWSASFPCQPFSIAGKGLGTDDDRHLWPVGRELIAKCRPPIIFGEQVASPAGREWLHGIRDEMEAMEYEVAAADLCAASAGAPHIRQRLFWLGHTIKPGLERHAGYEHDRHEPGRVNTNEGGPASKAGATGGMANAEYGHGRPKQQQERERSGGAGSSGGGELGYFWSDFDPVHCTDGKARRVEPGTFPLANGISARVGKLRAYGNAICPPLAKKFIEVVDEILRERP